ncbi:Uroporphyrinogen III synthase HEM4 [Thermocrinis albus DSM 14484]|uniref:Uroporphyrinogen-III synthase n=1 Tax=Thermocrinis albus (strain DSM 14484 / JCM 11386 / HI 11/12) TaxID=638303 RepID=D3SQ91_THEAH|nr:uroporphyrinogen-III synthase [Thermocrinis albus]ADC89328.1 Uroporphyrinogen III synthase HEM4 [Thermocrinis albus DSM 14484]
MRVLITRPHEEAQKDRKLLEREGFSVEVLPLIRTVPLDFTVPDEEFQFVVFASPRAVEYLLKKWRPKGGEKLVAVGEKTKRKLESMGLKVWAVPQENTARGLVELLRGHSGKVLLPRSASGREELIEGLKGGNLLLFPLDVYKTEIILYEKGKVSRALERNHVVYLASPSAVQGLLANLQKDQSLHLLKDKKVVCIGKTTKEEWQKETGLPALVLPKPSTEALIELLKNLV